MNINDRIQNIKTLLKYCPRSTRDVKIIEEKVGLFFGNFFNNDNRFTNSHYDYAHILFLLRKLEYSNLSIL